MDKRIIIFFIVLLIINPLNVYCKEIPDERKTILIILDEMDFETIKALDIKEKSIGIINMRTQGLYKDEGKESYFMSIATGRRQSIGDGEFKGLSTNSNGKLEVLGYDKILRSIISENKIVEVKTLSRLFQLKGKSIGYMGNDISSLLAADYKGEIEYGYKNIVYTKDFLVNKSSEILDRVDLLILSLNIKNDSKRLNILREYINENSSNHIIIFPQNISSKMNKKFNNTLYPILYIDSDKHSGLLTSDTTRREGIITNLDILPHILKVNNISNDTNIGSSLDSKLNVSPERNAEEIFNRVLSLNIIKNVLHFIVIVLELYVIFSYIFTKKDNCYKRKVIMNSIIIGIFLSFLFAPLKVSNYIVLYLTTIILLSIIFGFLSSFYISFNIGYLSLATYIIIMFGVFYNSDILYNSFLGYNNILVGGRFYGLNNSIMGVLLVTSIIGYYTVSNYIKSKYINLIIALIFYLTNIIAFSSAYGSNVGGYITSIMLLIISVYFLLFEKRKGKLVIFGGILIIVLGVIINVSLDLSSSNITHLGKTLLRIKNLGLIEVIHILGNKFKQLIFMIVVPPWSIIFFSQIYYIFKYYRNEKEVFVFKKRDMPYLEKLIKISLITGGIGLLINDTGVISFVYIITYLMAVESNLDKVRAIYK